MLLFFVFWFENLISDPKSYRDFRETDPRPVARFFLREVRSKEEADQTRPEKQVSRLSKVDPRSTLCNWLFNRKFESENSQSLKRRGKCVQSGKVRHKTKTNSESNVSPWKATATAITANGAIITSSGSSLKIRIIVIYMKGLGVDWWTQHYQSRQGLTQRRGSSKRHWKHVLGYP